MWASDRVALQKDLLLPPFLLITHTSLIAVETESIKKMKWEKRLHMYHKGWNQRVVAIDMQWMERRQINGA